MATRKPAHEQSEWAIVIKAQDQASQKLLKEEQDLQKKIKIRYKQELDKQLQAKDLVNKSAIDYRNDEKIFSTAQQIAIKNYECQKKNNDRSYQKIFLDAGKEDLDKKNKLIQLQLTKEKITEQERIKRTQMELETEKLIEMASKSKRIKQEQEEFNRQEAEKMKKIQMDKQQQINDRKMIEKKIEEMKSKENSYKEFYEKKIKDLETKMKNYKPVIDTDIEKQEFIRKRNEEWETTTKEKQLLKQKLDEEAKNRAVSEMKYELEKQIDYKKIYKNNEIQESIKHQQIAKFIAHQEKMKQEIEYDKKIKEKEQLRNVYDQQIQEKNNQHLQEFLMDQREKRIHEGVLRNLYGGGLVSFPSVPGVHTTEPPIKQLFDKIYPDDKNDSDSTPGKNLYQNQSRSYENSPNKNNYFFPDPYKHDPITNPIGSSLRRVLPGERATRNLQSHSRLAMAGNRIFN
jgi:hypothetical protein